MVGVSGEVFEPCRWLHGLYDNSTIRCQRNGIWNNRELVHHWRHQRGTNFPGFGCYSDGGGQISVEGDENYEIPNPIGYLRRMPTMPGRVLYGHGTNPSLVVCPHGERLSGGKFDRSMPSSWKILNEFCGTSGTAAIYLYVFRHYRELHPIGTGIGANELDYPKRFMHRVWKNLGKVVLIKWGNVAIYDDFKKRIASYHVKGLKVYPPKTMFWQNRKSTRERSLMSLNRYTKKLHHQPSLLRFWGVRIYVAESHMRRKSLSTISSWTSINGVPSSGYNHI